MSPLRQCAHPDRNHGGDEERQHQEEPRACVTFPDPPLGDRLDFACQLRVETRSRRDSSGNLVRRELQPSDVPLVPLDIAAISIVQLLATNVSEYPANRFDRHARRLRNRAHVGFFRPSKFLAAKPLQQRAQLLRRHRLAGKLL